MELITIEGCIQVYSSIPYVLASQNQFINLPLKKKGNPPPHIYMTDLQALQVLNIWIIYTWHETRSWSTTSILQHSERVANHNLWSLVLQVFANLNSTPCANSNIDIQVWYRYKYCCNSRNMQLWVSLLRLLYFFRPSMAEFECEGSARVGDIAIVQHIS